MKTAVILACIFLAIVMLFVLTPVGRTVMNYWDNSLRKTDDRTTYDSLKKVEDSARSMISTYNADKHTYTQYVKSEEKEKRTWAEQAKMRANTTASTYNNFVLKNSYVWKDNIPSDILSQLPFIE